MKSISMRRRHVKYSPLTKKQKQQVENNIGLVYHAYRRYKHLETFVDDLLGMCFEMLCEAVRRYDKDRGATISTFYNMMVDGAIKKEKQRSYRRQSLIISKMDPFKYVKIPSSDDIASRLDEIERKIILYPSVKRAISTLDPQSQLIIMLSAEKIPQVKIGQMIGLSQPEISCRLKEIRIFVKNSVANEDQI